MNPNVWLFRPLPHGTNQMKYFLDNNRVAVGYPVGENLENALTSHISSLLVKNKMSEGYNNLLAVVKPDIIKINDFLVVPDDNKKDIYICQVMSNYIYEAALDVNEEGSGFPHQRAVKWFFNKEPLVRLELPEQLRASLRYPGAIADLSKHYDVIIELVKGESVEGRSSLEEKALQIIEQYLDSEDPMLRLRAAEIILNKK
ncbi:hypothetical protein [Priestia megaterium]|uniref:hypothetical protein n=1 Tax=Priestia megaterium TaxID=1404 RepID=UPI0021D675E2|nr:hypothetical protein [Priestia megaterium]MCU7766489.1 hypothetical protein [Priestia megaterium]